jgi:hypothetical protein
MKSRAPKPAAALLSLRIQQLVSEIEKLVPELKAAVTQEDGSRFLLSSASRSLVRASGAVRALVEKGRGVEGLSGSLEGTAGLMSLLGSRVVLTAAGSLTPRTPSAGAKALALLLEEPARSFEAAEIAQRLGCSVPIARTTLNRLVQSGHATRPAAGRFRAKSR